MKPAVPSPTARQLTAFALRLQQDYEANSSSTDRKRKGQFFTPPEVCHFMAHRFSTLPKRFRLLDPGAGIGALSAAVCDMAIELRSPRHIEISLFENDASVLPFLKKTMSHCQNALAEAGHRMIYSIFHDDFVLHAAPAAFGKQRSLFGAIENLGVFDAVIMNPPYFKVRKDSAHAHAMQDVVHGQPNIYAFFLALGAQLLRPSGQLVAITPRSFCSGLYFRSFRRWFFERMALDHIHLFESRSHTFQKVLQESVITVAHRLGKQPPTVTLSTSRGRELLGSPEKRTLPTAAVIHNLPGDCFIRIPASSQDSAVLDTIQAWPHHFEDLGLRVSTGPVVTFRAREYLLPEPNGAQTAPLLNPSNIKPFDTVWPLTQTKHPAGFKVCPDSMRLLLPTRNYVLLRRFTAKEEHRRLVASQLLRSQFNWPYVALENHLNYVYHADKELTDEETLGLTALFNSSLLDRYFRILSGNTQVNATELRVMNFPDLETMSRIGAHLKNPKPMTSHAIERIVLHHLGVDEAFQSHLLGATLF